MGVVDFLADLVAIDTVNDPDSGKLVGISEAEKIASIIEKHTGWRMDIIINEGAPILLYRAGRGRPISLFLAHFDTVPPGPGWTKDPFQLTVEGTRAYGRGAADDKSNVVAIADALLGFELSRGTLLVAFTGDEEIGGKRGAGFLAEMLLSKGMMPDYLINGDGSLSRIIIRRRASIGVLVGVRSEKTKVRGCLREREFRARVSRETMHSAYFVHGVDSHPLVEASLWIRDSELYVVKLEGEWVKGNVLPRSVKVQAVDPSCSGDNVYDADLGLTRLLKSVIPLVKTPICTDAYSDYGVTINPNVYREANGEHLLYLDIRAMVRSVDSVRKALESTLNEAVGPDRYYLDIRGGRGYLYTSPESRLVKIARMIAKSMGLNDEPVEAGGASDSRYFSPRGVEAIDYGPLGGNIHGPDEYVYVDHLEKAVEFYRRVAAALHS